MVEWVLIITLYFSNGSGASVTMEKIEHIVSEQSCNKTAAIHRWTKATHQSWMHSTAVCTPVRKFK